jgi:hypothetical protein
VTVRFLLDENLSPRLRPSLLRRSPDLDVLRVGDEGAPPLGTPDPEVLLYAERERRLLITHNRASMPSHVADHLAAGRHHYGVMRIRPRASLRQIVEEMLVIAGASEAEEWMDRFDWIPL